MTENMIRERIDWITTRPMMFAFCRESYVAQLALLLELLGGDGQVLWNCHERQGACYVGLEARLEDDFVLKVNQVLFEEMRKL